MKIFFTVFLAIIVWGLSYTFGQNYYFGVGTPADTANTSCASCHNPQFGASPVYEEWITTKHSYAMDSLASTLGYSCLPCHNTGWNPNVTNYGADEYVDSLPNNEYQITNVQKFNKVKNVQCEVCHGPMGNADGTLSTDHWGFGTTNVPNYSAALCGTCHQGAHHPFYEEWQQSAHANSLISTFTRQNNGACYRCHTAQDFVAYLTDSTYNGTTFQPEGQLQPLACVACHDPHEKKYTAQLRVPIIPNVSNICDKCHTAGIDSVDIHTTPHHTTSECLTGSSLFGYHYPGVNYSNSPHTYAATNRCIDCHVHATPVDPATGIAYTGHTFQPRVAACAQPSCHGQAFYTNPGVDTSNPELRFNFDNKQVETRQLLAQLKAKLDAASHADSSTDAFLEANYNYNACESEGSFGVHNTLLVQKLLQDAIARFNPTTSVNEQKTTPLTYSLDQNYPNPFNPTTTIKYSIAKPGNVKITIYNAIGVQVVVLENSYKSAGKYKITWNAGRYASGIYFYRIESNNYNMVKKMVLIK